ncbi:A24 family peptidase [Neomoorella thermoacetica]|uniref:A24 family peptidase n=1 Tax=Neomoorella thermoacetica TaxID=1525 RepID=UPI0030D3CE1C
MHQLTWPAWLFFLSVTLVGVTDFISHYIPNFITLPLMVAGIFYHLWAGNWVASLIGASACFLLGLVMFAHGGMGGGDVKLMAAIGAWMGLYGALAVIFVASCIGGVWGLGKLVKQGRLKERLLYLIQGAYLTFVGGIKGALTLEKIPEDINAPIPKDAIPFGACLAAGVWVFMFLASF